MEVLASAGRDAYASGGFRRGAATTRATVAHNALVDVTGSPTAHSQSANPPSRKENQGRNESRQ